MLPGPHPASSSRIPGVRCGNRNAAFRSAVRRAHAAPCRRERNCWYSVVESVVLVHQGSPVGAQPAAPHNRRPGTNARTHKEAAVESNAAVRDPWSKEALPAKTGGPSTADRSERCFPAHMGLLSGSRQSSDVSRQCSLSARIIHDPGTCSHLLPSVDNSIHRRLTTDDQETDMKVAIGLGMTGEGSYDEATSYVIEAERLGVHSPSGRPSPGATTPSRRSPSWPRRRRRVLLGTGIMQSGTRTPALVAMTAMSIRASLSGDRFVLGLAASAGPQVIEGWHGIPLCPHAPPAHARDHGHRPSRLERRAPQLRRQGLIRCPGPTARAKRSAPGAPAVQEEARPYSSRDAQSQEPRAHRRARRWLARHVLHPGARGGVFFNDIERAPSEPGARSAISTSRPAASWRSQTIYKIIAAPQAGPGVHARRHGREAAQLLQRRLPPRRLRRGSEAQPLKWLEGDRVGGRAVVPDELVIQTNTLRT